MARRIFRQWLSKLETKKFHLKVSLWAKEFNFDIPVLKTSSLVGATVVGAVTGGKVVKTAPWQKVGLSTTKIEIYFERKNVIVWA